MFIAKLFRSSLAVLLGFWYLFLVAAPSYGRSNKVMGDLQFIAVTQADKHCGIWIDGQYVGYLGELKGDRQVALLPGEHEIVARESGYRDFSKTVVVEPGQEQDINVSLMRDPRARVPAVTAEVKLDVTPSRAAVFMDNSFLGPVSEFGGSRHTLLISPGKHRIKIALPGYQTFETEINLQPNQKFTLKTDLVAGSITQAGPLIKKP